LGEAVAGAEGGEADGGAFLSKGWQGADQRTYY
jgi:hypothetical protein